MTYESMAMLFAKKAFESLFCRTVLEINAAIATCEKLTEFAIVQTLAYAR